MNRSTQSTASSSGLSTASSRGCDGNNTNGTNGGCGHSQVHACSGARAMANDDIVTVGLSDVRNAPGHEDLDCCPPNAHILFIEAFCGGSHRQLLTTLLSDSKIVGSSEDVAVFTMPSKKWHWRARTASLSFSQRIPSTHLFKVLFCSATLNLCELIGLRPDLAQLHKVIYFHENQLVYPVREDKARDFQYGYNQIMSALSADCVLFNSQYNLDTFLREVPRHLNLQKDCRPDYNVIVSSIRTKSKVLYFPINICKLSKPSKDAFEPLHIIWPHRWEHDKDPETFFHVLFQLAETGHNFRVSVIGENFSETPKIFTEARQRLHNFIVNWGFAESRDKYWQILYSGDVVVSTAHHEFFGVAMLEAAGCGCFPLCPNRLVYPELYPQQCLYNTQQQLLRTLASWCVRPQALRSQIIDLDLHSYSWQVLRRGYTEVLGLPE